MEAQAALRAWFEVSPRHRETLWFAYRAALDREEAAARDLERLSQLAEPCLDRLSPPLIGESTAQPTP
jgi:hypothetical protein